MSLREIVTHPFANFLCRHTAKDNNFISAMQSHWSASGVAIKGYTLYLSLGGILVIIDQMLAADVLPDLK